jgi:hypothetical protein
MNSIQDIIARLERASGPDHEIDREIAEYLRTYSPPDRGSQEGDWPNYTHSIDAALTLAPKGFQAYVDTGVGAFSGDAHACVWTDYPHRISGGARQCFNPAIALCIAALRARDAAIRTVNG